MSEIEKQPAPPERDIAYGSLAAVTICAFALTACVVVLELATRGQMDLGGFGASGGPYEISHPAPSWSWLWPVSFVGIWIFAVAQAVFASRLKGFNLILPTWCALFLWAGVSFFQYGFSPPGDGGLAWGWIVCGLVFVPMGAIPLLAFLPKRVLKAVPVDFMPSSRRRPPAAHNLRGAYYALHAIAIAGGVAAGWRLFHIVAG